MSAAADTVSLYEVGITWAVPPERCRLAHRTGLLCEQEHHALTEGDKVEHAPLRIEWQTEEVRHAESRGQRADHQDGTGNGDGPGAAPLLDAYPAGTRAGRAGRRASQSTGARRTTRRLP